MRRKYIDCQRQDGNCVLCPQVKDGRDCKGNLITKLEMVRRAAGMTQLQLAEAADLFIRQIQKVERGEAEAGNLTAKNLLAIADALGVHPRDLI